VEASHLVLLAIILLTALALLMSGIAIMFQIRRDRLPDATRFENIRELRAQAEQLLAERRAELSTVEQKIQQRDRLIAEVAALEAQRTAISAELATLGDARREIEEVKSEAAQAAADLARVSHELTEKRAELERITAECDPGRVADLKIEMERLQDERGQLELQLAALRVERDGALQKIEEARAAQAVDAAREVKRDQLLEEIKGLDEHQLVAEQLRLEVTQLRTARDELAEEVDRLGARKFERERLLEDIKGLEEQQEKFDHLKSEVGRVRSRRDELAEEVDRLAARKERIADAVAGQPVGSVDPRDLLNDLIKVPTSLELPAISRRSSRQEPEALNAVLGYLRAYNLDFSTRTLLAFHTALKINDHSQLTVLAGVSGTGKSLLPRRYAEAVGFHFLQVAVEPRWDSPQDLLGFYNYIEKNYRATDLARILMHMDPYNSNRPAGTDRTDHVALVLLDEMNLARVEYYFSEFLSRLEARPRYEDVGDERKRIDAMIPIDIRGLVKPISLFPSHNVLFAGTMNDDESTQALSDKVLDRSNILQFAAPREFPQLSVVNGVERPNEAQSFRSWRTWIRSASTLNGANRQLVESVVSKLADIMEECGRPFGHRLRDAMIAYVANYPSLNSGAPDFRVPLADQIEFRILPKLRGLEIDSHREALDNLDKLLRGDLNDWMMADRLAEARERQARGTGLFVWRGLTRER
jgi:uncharacterized coiled-coil DUF342 family protein